jgi:hypothetical protein
MNFDNNDMKSFNLKDLINIENIPKDILESIVNNTPIDLGINEDIHKENKNTIIEEEIKSTSISNNSEILSEEDRLKNVEILKKKLRNKEEELRHSRKSKNQKEDSRIKMLKENPLFKDLGSLNTPEAKKMIDTMASKMCSDPKQKKAMKKQMEKLINKMDSTTL